MTRRSFIRNLGLAAAALGVPVAALGVHGMQVKTFKFDDVTNCRAPLYRARFGLDDDPPRFNWTGTEYVRVEPTNHIGAPNLEWVDAKYELLR